MAVENLYNTAVEYHSPLAAEPPSTLPSNLVLCFQGPVIQTHLSAGSGLQEYNKGQGITYDIFRQNCGCDGCLLYELCFLSLLTVTQWPANDNTQKYSLSGLCLWQSS